MECENRYLDAHADLPNGYRNEAEHQTILDASKDAIPKWLVDKATVTTVNELEDSNYHSSVSAILDQRPDLQAKLMQSRMS